MSVKNILFLDTEYRRFSSVFFHELSSRLGRMDIIKMKTPPFHLNYAPTLFSKITRMWLPFFLFAVRGFIKGLGYDVIISWSGVVGLFVGFLKLIFLQDKPTLFVKTFIFRPRANKIINWFRFWSCKICTKKMDGIICHSSDEVSYYTNLFHLSHKQIRFIPYGIELPNVNFQKKGGKPYIASAGRSNRDYELLRTAMDGIEMKVKIYCSRDHKKILRNVKNSNFETHIDTPLEEFLRALSDSLFVVVPLKIPEISSGQLVLLQAMALGKAVIATDCWGTRDYIKHMENGILVAPNNASELREKILYLLDNPEEVGKLGRDAKKTVEEYFNIRSFASSIGNYIKETQWH